MNNIIIGIIISLIFLSCTSNELVADQREARVVEIIDYRTVRFGGHSAIFLENNKVLHITNTGSGLTVGDQIRSSISIGDIIKYEYGEHVRPQWERHAGDLYERFQISADLIIDSAHLLEINGISILSFFYYDEALQEHWKHLFPHLKNYNPCDCFAE